MHVFGSGIEDSDDRARQVVDIAIEEIDFNPEKLLSYDTLRTRNTCPALGMALYLNINIFMPANVSSIVILIQNNFLIMFVR